MSGPAIQMPNLALAKAMITAGCEFAPQEEGGPCLNNYTPGFLRDKRIIGNNPLPMDVFEKRVLETFDAGIPGHVTYYFRRNEQSENVVKAWDATAELVKAHREWEAMTPRERETSTPPSPLPEIPDEVIAQVLCLYANNTDAFRKYPFVNAPICNAMKGTFEQGETKGGAKNTATGVAIGTTTGSGKVWSTDLPNVSPDPDKPDRQKMKLHPRIR